MLRQAGRQVGRLLGAAQRRVGAEACAAAACPQLQGTWGGSGFATNSHDIFNVHRDSPGNNWETDFDFTPDNYERVGPHAQHGKKAAELISRFPINYKQSACIPLLDLAQKQNNGWLSLAAMNRVAKVLEMPEIRVYEVATFYTMFNRTPIGKLHVMVCGTTPCMLCGARGIYQALKQHLGIDYGQTTKDGWFTLGEMECMGSCVNAPMIAIADYRDGAEGYTYSYYEDLTAEAVVAIVDELKAGKQPRVGSQHRRFAEPSGQVQDGKWVVRGSNPTPTLRFEANGGKVPGPYCRDLDEVPQPAQDTKGAPKGAPPSAHAPKGEGGQKGARKG